MVKTLCTMAGAAILMAGTSGLALAQYSSTTTTYETTTYPSATYSAPAPAYSYQPGYAAPAYAPAELPSLALFRISGKPALDISPIPGSVRKALRSSLSSSLPSCHCRYSCWTSATELSSTEGSSKTENSHPRVGRILSQQ